MPLDTQHENMTHDFKVVGTRPVRPDGLDKVTGRARYGADMSLPGMIFGEVVRADHAHAKIVSIDTSAAEALPGVHAVITRADFPAQTGGMADVLDHCMADGEVCYDGHAVAAVVTGTLSPQSQQPVKQSRAELPHW